jgi:heat shock protein HslJ
MKMKIIFLISLSAVLLSACAGNIEPEQTPDNPSNNAEEKAPVEETEETENAKLSVQIAPELADCEGGAGPQKCMRVKFEDSEDWQFFYGQIEGFDYEEGYQYTLMVEKMDVANPPADGSSIRYVLVDEVSKEEVLIAQSGNLKPGERKLVSMGSPEDQLPFVTGQEATFSYDPETGQVSGTTGCNQYFGEVQVNNEAKTISFGPLVTTKMACRGDLNQQEIDFLTIMNEVTHFAVDAGRLVLFTEGAETIEFLAVE